MQLGREPLSYLIEIVAGEIVEPQDRFRVLPFDRTRDKSRIVFGPHVRLNAAKRLFQRGRLPFALGKILVGRRQIRGLVQVARLQFPVAQDTSQPVLDAPMDAIGSHLSDTVRVINTA